MHMYLTSTRIEQKSKLYLFGRNYSKKRAETLQKQKFKRKTNPVTEKSQYVTGS